MSELIWVSPQNYLLSQKDWKSNIKKNGYIPILKADLLKLENSLQISLKSRFSSIPNNLISDTKKKDASQYSKESNASEEDDKFKYKPIDIFLKANNPLLTFCIGSLVYIESVDKTNILIDEWIDYLKEQSLEPHEREILHFVSWSRIFATGFETQNIFIQMSIDSSDYKSYYTFLRFIYKLSKKSNRFSINFDDNIHRLIGKQSFSSNGAIENMDIILQHIENILDRYMTNKEQNNKDNQINQATSEEYTIDLSTLSDLPRESLKQLCKDIIGFRSRVFTMEREKMLRDSIEENQQRRKKMVQVFEEISKKQNIDNDSVNDILMMNDGDMLYPDDSEFNEDDDGYEVEQEKKIKLKQDSDIRYKKLLNKLKSLTEVRLQHLELKIKNSENYDDTLDRIRPAAIKELLHLGKDIYYDSREISRNKEKQQDDMNRQKYGTDVGMSLLFDKFMNGIPGRKDLVTEIDAKSISATIKSENDGKEHASNAEINIKLNFNKALGKLSDTSEEKENIDSIIIDNFKEGNDTKNNIIDFKSEALNRLPFTDEDLDNRLKALKKTGLVEELVKEYLGVYEEELVEYIFDNIKEFRDKDSLFEELKETFDDDAKDIVDKIWNSKELSSLN
ncbi:Snu71p PWA37_004530 [Arxiozyma heterogenica]|uniref:Snu71p n=1 Tax=Arxiozyma heterogenica TaxID=278026 RepID=UPI002F1C8E7E